MSIPLCPYFNHCGGCTTQHLDYSVQIENKSKELKRITGCSEIEVFTGPEYHYRSRMDFVFHHRGLGLRSKGINSSVVDVKECVISNPAINVILTELRVFFNDVDAFDLRKKQGTFRTVVVRVTSLGESFVSFVLNEDSPRLAEAMETIQRFVTATSVLNVLVAYVPATLDGNVSEEYVVLKGSDFIQECYLGKTFWYSVQGFFQNNYVVAGKMQEYCRTLFQGKETFSAHLLDLYGGVGTFGIINADLFKSVIIVESVPSCIIAAKRNCVENEIKNVNCVLLDAKNLRKLTFPSSLYVITDPPRSGMDQRTIQQLMILRPKVIVYISCNLQQFAKDLLKLKQYSVQSVALFDLFPQTNHSEAVVELVLRE
ncbi:TPA: 23S rRNA (uracil(1939)-C(5))-methyltransferase RlmD [Candidatus Woesearchaeota archaeon]|nr:23S rRNA (uracil(1939)-C(5))-methyltransferase RlmD [Candidatus Woesearchaeota archaeon]